MRGAVDALEQRDEARAQDDRAIGVPLGRDERELGFEDLGVGAVVAALSLADALGDREPPRATEDQLVEAFRARTK